MYQFFFRNFILRLDPEHAHRVAVWAFRYGWPFLWLFRKLGLIGKNRGAKPQEIMGLRFASPLGVAAGLDKNAEAVRGLFLAGFSHVEVGTVTFRAQPGNPRPRSWRELDLHALRNQMGFNNAGAKRVERNLAKLRRSRIGKQAVVGVNIGKNKEVAAAEAPENYAAVAKILAPYADYIAVNVSSPNTPGLRQLQAVDSLRPILLQVQAAIGPELPLLVKIAPDLADDDVAAVANLVKELGIAGVIATNTTISHDRGPGGLSGPPLLHRAVEVVAQLRSLLGSEFCIIGVGGVTTAEDAQKMLVAGADLLQGYTALVYQGPWWPGKIAREPQVVNLWNS